MSIKSAIVGGVSLSLCAIMVGVVATVLIARAYSEATFLCYRRGGIVRLPVASTGSNGAVWQYFTNAFGRMYLLLDLGVTDEGPEFHRYYREPIVVLSKDDLQRLESSLRNSSVRKKELEKATVGTSQSARKKK